ncbi:MAG: biopolymer transporter ExbD [Spirochaetaceae bacterium]|jgi:biopolymer transport protein ExbD|nr:biopolymer transporter ExbD [Spirochaetaceae bacterium]
MKSFARKTEPFGATAGVDITPMLDVIFQLLLFFILTSALMQPNIKLDLPESSQNSETVEADLVISAGKDGRIYFNDRNVLPEEVEVFLRQFIAQNSDGLVILRVDSALPYGSFFSILDASRGAGVKNLHLAHEEK